ncbi:ketosynthase chain-length factor [Actinomycetospora termitidis]|uniref:Ketosynthase chain-length factor n=1 Tax=Actinomycetospora termitidis TaxID=3053470 RepID=A0ABT7MFB7_9PSEU|nr:ketosynthase chain-length factor [Actinomycetospora sp. Odt1-22]MDL5158582.1 ketosynthase chain-length factor [Actinomycetospora sp. Odt1-22]
MTAVVTGLGVLAPTGAGVETYWAATLAGRSALAPPTRFDATGYPHRLAGEIDLDVAALVPRRLLAQTDHMTRLALVAAEWALADAVLEPAEQPEYAMSVATACSSGGFEFGQRELQKLWGHGPHQVSAYQSFAWFYAVNTGQISIRHGMRGPSGVLVAEQAGGLDVLGQARRLLRGPAALVVSGAVDASLCPWGWVATGTSGRVSTSDDSARAFLPFDAAAGGHVVGEGGALLVVEEAAAAAARGVTRPYGTVAGYAATFDPRDPRREPGLRRAVVGALADAGLEPSDVGVVYADAAGTPELDEQEAAALRDVFGANRVPVTAPKAGVGRLSSGGGPLDVATALLGLRDAVVPPTPNVTAPRPDLGLDLVVGGAREVEHDAALVLARGQGGFNAAVVVTRP